MQYFRRPCWAAKQDLSTGRSFQSRHWDPWVVYYQWEDICRESPACSQPLLRQGLSSVTSSLLIFTAQLRPQVQWKNLQHLHLSPTSMCAPFWCYSHWLVVVYVSKEVSIDACLRILVNINWLVIRLLQIHQWETGKTYKRPTLLWSWLNVGKTLMDINSHLCSNPKYDQYHNDGVGQVALE